MRRPVLVTPPDILPVSLAEAKAHLRVDYDDDDGLILSLIRAAVDHLDGWTGILGRCLVEQEWRQDFPAGATCFPLPLGPVISVTSVTVAGNAVDTANYALRTDAGGRSHVEITSMSISDVVSISYRAMQSGRPTKRRRMTPEEMISMAHLWTAATQH